MRNTTVSAVTTGTITKLSRAMRTSSSSITAARPMIFTTFLKSLARMLAYSSWTASTSLVTRVTILPTGVRSKKRMERLWMCSKSCRRMV